MEYLLGAIAGFGAGAGIGAIKNLIIWRAILKDENRKISVKQYNRRTFLSAIIDIAVLAAVFFTKDILPFYFPATILCAILGIALSRRIAPAQETMRHVG